MRMAWTVAIAGATGYAGGEVLRLIAEHPELEVSAVCAGSSRGLLGEHQPHLLTYADMELQATDPAILAGANIAILGLPHGASGEVTAAIEALNPETIIIDLGADHRLENPQDWRDFYGSEPAQPWTYGMPELIRKTGESQRELLANTKRIAAPGCNASAVTFAAQVAVNAGLTPADADSDIVATLAVGYSGAGKAMKSHLMASEAFGAAAPYAVGGTHRHIPEIAQNLRTAGGDVTTLSFTPVLVPMSRGILAVVSMPATEGITDSDVREAYAQAYENEPFLRTVDTPPTSASVTGANTAHIWAGLDRDGERITAICAIDNLVKGTAGAAIQSLNCALSLPEDTGLIVNGVAP